MKKYIMFLLLACVVGVGYAEVYVKDQVLYVDNGSFTFNSSDKANYDTGEIIIGNATKISIKWEDLTNENYATLFCSFDGSNSFNSCNTSITSNELLGHTTINFRLKRNRTNASLTLENIKVAASSVQIDYTRESLTSGNIGTICLPNAVAEGDYRGAVFYKIAGKSKADTEVYFSEVTSLEAGKPYVFEATESALHIVYSGDPVANASSENGLYGVFERFAFADHLSELNINDVYIIKDNSVQKASAKSGVNANRAYLKLNEIPSISSAPEGRTLVLGYEPEESGSQTGVGDIIDEEDVPLIIHTLQGQRVKKVVKDDFYIVNRKEVKYLKAE